ncbi:uncharacterized protein LOC124304581 isoform X1 [Neodiprion virginianus]|uniref:uncharacterized protein LOC124304581 isoform X1 n=1 Tax=Neodiprion virginianus TaxID=2961670 RepID=UPI001EE75356|nr:uncharacterized protein LOC124304581 isoform X1 [Neodiprion virginianus]
MPKSRLSAPSGSDRRNKSYDWGTRDWRQNPGNRRGYGGYGQFQADKYECFVPGRNDASPQSTGDDFIPLGFSTPVDYHPRSSGNWRGQKRGRDFNQHRYSFNLDSPRTSFNDSNSPKFFHKHQFSPRGVRKSHQKNVRRQTDISAYVDAKSMLEDPWADLMTKLETSQSFCGRNNDSTNLDASGSSCGSILMGNLTVDSNGKNSSSESQESQIAAHEKSETKTMPS